MHIKPLFLLFLLLFTLGTHAQERIALVIGNADYQTSPLNNSVNDAQDMASTLKELDFKVTLVTDGNKQTMESAIVKFGDKLNKDTVGLFYYSGHAVQYKGSNYLVPIGSVGQVNKVEDLPSSTVAANLILNKLEGSLSKLNFVFLDSCRDNPFANLGNQITPGLAKTEGGSDSGSLGLPSLAKGMFTSRGITKERVKPKKDTTGTLVAYSTMPGKVAADGSGRNSPYTKHLLERIKEPNALVQIMLSDVMSAVEKETNGKQTPIYEAAISGRFCFKTVNNQCGKTVNIYSSFLEGVEDVQSLVIENDEGEKSNYMGQLKDGKAHGKGIAAIADGSRHEGDWKDGKKHGKGIYTMADGSRFEGEYKNGKLHGKTINTMADGSRFEGQLKDGIPHGEGILAWANGTRYEGGYKDGKHHGKGILTFPSGSRYEGEFKNGKQHGKGIFTKPDGFRYEGIYKQGKGLIKGVSIKPNGTRYEGEIKNGKRHGKGIIVTKSGIRYEGGWKDGKEHGKGILTYANGARYEGEFKDGKHHGKGILTYASGTRYEGNWKDGKEHGKGIINHLDGTRYEGEVKNGKVHGKGILTYVSGTRYKGNWKDGGRHGKFIITFPDGERHEVEYDKDILKEGLDSAEGGSLIDTLKFALFVLGVVVLLIYAYRVIKPLVKRPKTTLK